jgi:two-component system sensor histidine kinase HydH
MPALLRENPPVLPHPPSGSLQQVQHEALSRLFGRFVGVRLAIAPLMAMLPVWVVLTETALWRRAVMAAVAISLIGLSWVELQRFRRHGLRPLAIPLNLGISVTLQFTVIILTGGVESPLLPALPLMAVLVSIFIQSDLSRRLVVGGQVAALWALALVQFAGALPDLLPVVLQTGPRAHPSAAHLLVTAGVVTVLLLAAFQIGTQLRSIYDAMLRQALAARDEALWTYSENLQRLTTMTAEIAHELKNPLASIKGLATLVLRDTAGKSAERMGVLLQEVNRMQGILREFLDFSRPLGPLVQEQVNLRELCETVSLLHEGVTAERQLTLHLQPGPPLTAYCDASKVKQILINLLQNALEASPPGQEVSIELAPLASGQARVSVLDRGTGLQVLPVERLFQVGMTSKPQGSGLGLPIARSLARQHGGELSLHPREGGGCHAMLVLPLEPLRPVPDKGLKPAQGATA